MFNVGKDFSAAPQAIGFIYQIRFGLLLALTADNDSELFIEGSDDIQIDHRGGITELGSLKHRHVGNRITDSSTDFWKSIRIWLTKYDQAGRIGSNQRYTLYTTSSIGKGSFLHAFTQSQNYKHDELETEFKDIGGSTDQTLIRDVIRDYQSLEDDERKDFLSRVSIVQQSDRINEISDRIKQSLFGGVPRSCRDEVFQRLEGWWQDRAIRQMIDPKQDGIPVVEVHDTLALINDEYKTDNLPITFRFSEPSDDAFIEAEKQVYVRQLKELHVHPDRITNAIIDYYRASEQRAQWANNGLVVWSEIEEFDTKLYDEWNRHRLELMDEYGSQKTEEAMERFGKILYNWSQSLTTVQIRVRVSEPYISRGSYHIMANTEPKPKVYWHPKFLERISEVLAQ